MNNVPLFSVWCAGHTPEFSPVNQAAKQLLSELELAEYSTRPLLACFPVSPNSETPLENADVDRFIGAVKAGFSAAISALVPPPKNYEEAEQNLLAQWERLDQPGPSSLNDSESLICELSIVAGMLRDYDEAESEEMKLDELKLDVLTALWLLRRGRAKEHKEDQQHASAILDTVKTSEKM